MPGPRPDVLAVVLAGGPGTRLDVLTERRAKPAMPFAGVYRLIDFPLSNAQHSELTDVWVIEQFEPVSLSDHLSNGRPWDLDRTHGGLLVLHPFAGREEGGFHSGTADAIQQFAPFIREADPDVLVVMSSDHIYRLDYRDVVDRHLEAGADVTMATTRNPRDDLSRFGVVDVADDGRIRRYVRKPDDPPSDVAVCEVYAFRPDPLLEVLDDLPTDRDEAEDLGDATLPRLVDDGTAVEYRLDGYWRDVGTISAYWGAHMDLLHDEEAVRLDDPSWPIHTLRVHHPPAHLYRTAEVRNSLVSPGSSVHGEIEDSILAPGVRIAAGAVVRRSIILEDVLIEAGAVVDTAIVDTGVVIREGARVGGDVEGTPTDDDITLVGQDVRIDAGAEVRRGARCPPREVDG